MPDKILELEATMRDRVSDTLRVIKRNIDDLNKSTVNLATQRKEMATLGQEASLKRVTDQILNRHSRHTA